MGESRQKKIRMAHDGIAKVLSESGRMVEYGFEIHAKFYLPDTLTPEQRELCRECFMMGAQHFYASIMSVLDDGLEPTNNDMRRMRLADAELDVFVRHFKRKHNIKDEIYPQKPMGTQQ